MRRADRLFQIVQFLRSRRLTTAQWLAQRLEVSVRTVYRDIQDLSLSGVPIEGEAGVGYVLRQGMDLPPLMFDRAEIEALVIGARMVKAWADPEMQRAAESALAKIHNVVPEELRAELNRNRMFAPGTERYPLHWIGRFRAAIREQHVILIRYETGAGVPSERRIRPLGLVFWGQVWTLCSWCELRQDFRNFRIDRVITMIDTGDRFLQEDGKRLEDYLAEHAPEEALAPLFRA